MASACFCGTNLSHPVESGLLMTSVQKSLVFDDVSKHNKADDCWLIISGKVYDVTPFIDNHPGGGEVWLRATGKDATIDFSDVGHSDIARGKMKKYCIGEIDQSTIPLTRSYIQSMSEMIYNSKSTLQLIVKLLLVGIMAAAFKYYLHSPSNMYLKLKMFC